MPPAKNPLLESLEPRLLLDGALTLLDSPIVEAQKQALSDGLEGVAEWAGDIEGCLLYTSPSPRDRTRSRMPSSA